MPTKIPPYLVSSTPILVYGPGDIAQVKYAKEDGWGLVVDKKDLDLLKKGLISLISNSVLCEKIIKRAALVALKNHDQNIVRKEFHNALCSI